MVGGGGQPLLKPCLADHITLRVDSSSENKTQLQGPNSLGYAKFSLGKKWGKKGGVLTKSASWLRQLWCKECKKARETESWKSSWLFARRRLFRREWRCLQLEEAAAAVHPLPCRHPLLHLASQGQDGNCLLRRSAKLHLKKYYFCASPPPLCPLL